jgi:hypothetical protein
VAEVAPGVLKIKTFPSTKTGSDSSICRWIKHPTRDGHSAYMKSSGKETFMSARMRKAYSAGASGKAKVKSVPTIRHPEGGSRENERAAKAVAPTSVQPVEPEDNYLTGVSRSLQRRLLGLNVEAGQGQSVPHPETVPGIHSTGSFTNPEDVRRKPPEEGEK